MSDNMFTQSNKDEWSTLTVGQLIEELKRFPKDYTVQNYYDSSPVRELQSDGNDVVWIDNSQ